MVDGLMDTTELIKDVSGTFCCALAYTDNLDYLSI